MSNNPDALAKEVADLRKTVQQHEVVLDKVIAALGATARALGDYANVVARTFPSKEGRGTEYPQAVRDAIWPAYQAMNTLVDTVERIRRE